LVKKQEEDSTDMILENLIVEKTPDGVCVVSINRPKALNALNSSTLKELKQVLTLEAADASTRVLVLTGTGEKAFIAGADISEMKDMTSGEAVAFSKLGHDVAKILDQMGKPTIAAVNGFALGGGTELACSCDFIFSSEKALFGQPEVCLGVIPGFGGTFRLAKFVGYPKAKELIFSGSKINAEEAKRIGLSNEVFLAEDLMPKTLETARAISKNSRFAVAETKRLLNEFTEHSGLNFKIDSETQAFGKLFGSFDQKEGMTAFTEKRKPSFKE
jgi:enoyl-CoA hydratase